MTYWLITWVDGFGVGGTFASTLTPAKWLARSDKAAPAHRHIQWAIEITKEEYDNLHPTRK